MDGSSILSARPAARADAAVWSRLCNYLAANPCYNAPQDISLTTSPFVLINYNFSRLRNEFIRSALSFYSVSILSPSLKLQLPLWVNTGPWVWTGGVEVKICLFSLRPRVQMSSKYLSQTAFTPHKPQGRTLRDPNDRRLNGSQNRYSETKDWLLSTNDRLGILSNKAPIKTQTINIKEQCDTNHFYTQFLNTSNAFRLYRAIIIGSLMGGLRYRR